METLPLNIPVIPGALQPIFQYPLSQTLPNTNPVTMPVSVSKETTGTGSAAKIGGGLLDISSMMSVAKMAMGASGSGTAPATATGAPATSGSGAAASGGGSIKSGDINFGSSMLGASLNPQVLIVLGGVALVVVLIMLKQKSK